MPAKLIRSLPFLIGVSPPCAEPEAAVLFMRAGEIVPSHHKHSEAQSVIRRAKSVCGRCPVWEACREHGVRADEEWGIWGGLTPQERDTARRRARRARRKKDKPAQPT